MGLITPMIKCGPMQLCGWEGGHHERDLDLHPGVAGHQRCMRGLALAGKARAQQLRCTGRHGAPGDASGRGALPLHLRQSPLSSLFHEVECLGGADAIDAGTEDDRALRGRGGGRDRGLERCLGRQFHGEIDGSKGRVGANSGYPDTCQ